ncbi:MAG: hypothetical protein WBF31_11310, partial [Anaerolineae bacterium]
MLRRSSTFSFLSPTFSFLSPIFSFLSSLHSARGRLAPRLSSLVHLLAVFSVIVLGVLAVACGPVGDSSRRPPLLPMQP